MPSAVFSNFFFPVAVVLVFVVCWTPFHAQRLMFAVVTLQERWGDQDLGYIHHYLFVASGTGIITTYQVIG